MTAEERARAAAEEEDLGECVYVYVLGGEACVGIEIVLHLVRA